MKERFKNKLNKKKELNKYPTKNNLYEINKT